MMRRPVSPYSKVQLYLVYRDDNVGADRHFRDTPLQFAHSPGGTAKCSTLAESGGFMNASATVPFEG